MKNDELPNPAGATIRSAQGNARADAPMTGQQPVGASPTELIKALEAQGCRVDRDFIEWPDGTWLRASGGVIEKAASLFAAQDRRIEAMRRALTEIATKGVTKGYGRSALAAIARAALKEPTDAE